MSKGNLDQFIPVVLGDPTLQDQLRSVKGTDLFVQTVVRMGKEQGYEFSADDVNLAVQQRTGKASRDLTDEELGQITGGAARVPDTRNPNSWGPCE